MDLELPEGHFTDDDITSYRRLFSELSVGDAVCEIGSFYGKSICCVADIIRAKQLSVSIVDSFGDLLNGGGAPVSLPRFMESIERFLLTNYITIYCGLSANMSAEIKTDFDLIFIDANHDYSAVKQDIDLYRSKIKLGGILGGHDYIHPPVLQAVKEAFGNSVESHPTSIWIVRFS